MPGSRPQLRRDPDEGGRAVTVARAGGAGGRCGDGLCECGEACVRKGLHGRGRTGRDVWGSRTGRGVREELDGRERAGGAGREGACGRDRTGGTGCAGGGPWRVRGCAGSGRCGGEACGQGGKPYRRVEAGTRVRIVATRSLRALR
ncbi:hypothetical protein GCM10022252_67210 [Streptosporangium oxazolinicum]|uniref:Uncharacterized protein n=1 Tax=Streptosporangium oxazolinicum TaxID=909287 RepID=A0ABP8BG97_9ACTN